MRINARGVDFAKFRLQPSDDPFQPMSHFTDYAAQSKRKFFKLLYYPHYRRNR